jgi:hypothetical protein
VANATANTGASVDSEPSIRPVIAGCARCSRNDRSSRCPDGRANVKTVMIGLLADLILDLPFRISATKRRLPYFSLLV